MTPPKLVVRIGVGLPNLWSVDRVVTDEDATLLEAVVEAAREMRKSIICERSQSFYYPNEANGENRKSCECSSCRVARAFDAAWSRLETP
jgi:hypothetical protein